MENFDDDDNVDIELGKIIDNMKASVTVSLGSYKSKQHKP
jgi:hypothetical protein